MIVSNSQHATVVDKNDGEVSLKDFILKIRDAFFFLRTKWLIIVVFGLTGGALGFMYASTQKFVYSATLTFALEDDKSGGGGLSGALGLASSFGFDLGTSAGGAFSGGNLMELMKSRTLVEKTLLSPVTIDGKVTSLAERYVDFTEMRKGWEKRLELANIHFFPTEDRSKYTLSQDSILGSIYESLILHQINVSQRSTKISIINIEVNTTDQLFSKYFAEMLAKVVSDFYVDAKSKKAKFNVAILQYQTDSIRGELSGAISGVAAANDNTFNLNSALNIKRVPSIKRQVDVQANTAILTQLVTNLELAKVTLRRETPLIQVIDAPMLPLKKTKIGKLRSFIAGGFLGGVLIIIILFIRRWWKKVSDADQIC
jgi:hypothetical protein